jgi:Zn-finger nucleic acid-binding protein
MDGKFLVERCHRCHGLFFDLNELQALIDMTIKHSYEIDYKRLHQSAQQPLNRDEIIYKKCPVCSKFMQRRNYEKTSGIIIDVCAKHGIWLDAGELKQIYEWVKAGGIHRSKEQIKERTAREARYEKERSYRRRYDASRNPQGSRVEREFDVPGLFEFFGFDTLF